MSDEAGARRETTAEREARFAAAEALVQQEWRQFQRVRNEGGRASCQDDFTTFQQMRLCQFLTWPLALQRAWSADLAAAERAGHNLLTEKYARMMASTEPERYAQEIAPHLPDLTPDRIARQERVVARQVAWAADFHARHPRLAAAMRPLATAADTREETSLETYLRGEIGTYSDATFAAYEAMVAETTAAGGNLTELTMRYTVALSGYESLAAAEADV